MLGLPFAKCNKFGLSVGFSGCALNHSSFYQCKIKGTSFSNCQLQEVDFTEADLSAAVFERCDFGRAQFDQTNLTKADFRTSFNFVINPENNQIKKARFSIETLAGLLAGYDIVVD